MRIRRKSMFMILMVMLICVFVMPVSASAAKMNKKSATMYTGKTLQLKVTGTSKKAAWSSSRKSVVKVNQKGKITAVKKGSAVIRAKIGKKTYQCKVTVKQRATSVSLNKDSYFMVPGKTWTPQVTVQPSNTNDKRIQWSSSNKAVAKVNSKGKITAVANGTAVITATTKDGSKRKASCTVYVLKGGNTSNTTTGSTTESKIESTTGAASQNGESALARKFLALLEKYSRQIQSDAASGTTKWFYSNSGAPAYWSTDIKNAQEKGKSCCNCALLARWGLRDLGVIGKRDFWGEPGGEINFRGDSKTLLQQHCQIIRVYKTPNQLLKEGNLLPGDICTWVEYGHTNVYAGDGLWYDAGRNGNLGGYKSGTFYFKTFGPAATVNMSGTTVGYIIRLIK